MLLVWRKKAVGAYLLERPSGVVVGLKDLQTAMAEAQQTSGEDYSGDWGERHDEELDAQQTSGEDYSGDWGERHDEELTGDAAQQTSGEAGEQAQAVDYASLPLERRRLPRGVMRAGTPGKNRYGPGTNDRFLHGKLGRRMHKFCKQK